MTVPNGRCPDGFKRYQWEVPVELDAKKTSKRFTINTERSKKHTYQLLLKTLILIPSFILLGERIYILIPLIGMDFEMK